MADPGCAVASVVVGGACGGLLVEVLQRRGVMPMTAATAVAIGGGLGALALRGTARQVALGAAAASVGRLALAFLERWVTATATPGDVAPAVEEPHDQVAGKPAKIVLEIPPQRPPLEEEAGSSDADLQADEGGPDAVEGRAVVQPDSAGSASAYSRGPVPCPAHGDEGRDRGGAGDRAAAQSVC